MALNSGGVLSYDLGTNSDLTIVGGNLTLGGTLNVTDAGGFTSGTFKLFDCAGALMYNGVSLSSMPAGFNSVISTNTPGEVDLVVTSLLTAFEQWQVDYFGSTNNPAADPNADPDGDGLSNMAEFLSGTDPTNSTSALRITSVVRTNDDLVIVWTSGPSKTNALQSTAGSGDGSYQTNNFADIYTVTDTVGTVTNYLDPGAATNSPSQYYRIRLVP